jgi:hypothetical protein
MRAMLLQSKQCVNQYVPIGTQGRRFATVVTDLGLPKESRAINLESTEQ